jgi:hypothetical protein
LLGLCSVDWGRERSWMLKQEMHVKQAVPARFEEV